jgi:hypothetical protein
MTPRSISFTDLAKVPGAVGIMERNNKDEINNLLSQLGFDVKLGFEINVCHHRALSTNQAVYGPRVEGWELMTPEWINSDNSSVEAKVESCTDYTLREELLKLNKQGCSDRSMTDENVAKNVIKNQKECK